MANENHADFTPVIPDSGITPQKAPYVPVGSFKFWAQKVLPTVYDDSLSYYEVLTKLVWQINKMIEDMDNFNQSIDSTNEAFGTLQTYVNTMKDTFIATYNELQDYVNHYFDNLDIQEEINNKLDAMASSGQLSILLSPFIPDLVTTWLNQHVNPVGSAVVVDDTLSIKGAAADSAKVGCIGKGLGNDPYFDFFPMINTAGAYSGKGITCAVTDDLHFVFNGTSTGIYNLVCYYDTAITPYFNKNNLLHIHLETRETINNPTDLTFQMWYLPTGGSLTYLVQTSLYSKDAYIRIPSDAEKIYFRFNVPAGVTLTDADIKPQIYNVYEELEWDKLLNDQGILDIHPMINSGVNPYTANGITCTPSEDGWFTFNGTSTADYNFITYYDASRCKYFKPGDTLHFHLDVNNDTADSNYITFEVFTKNSQSASLVWRAGLTQTRPDFTFLIPYETLILYFRFRLVSGKTISNAKFRPRIYNISNTLNNPNIMNSKGVVVTGTDLNNLKENGVYLLTTYSTYSNLPPVDDHTGLLLVFNSGTVFFQMFLPWFPNTIYMRRKHTDQNEFSSWYQVSGGGGGSSITNEYIFNEYSNTFTATVSPTITTDTNNWLQPTGDTTDCSASILSLLQTGVCQLSAGTFYVDPNKLKMPDDSTLRGCGQNTVIKLIGSASGYCVKMGSRCNIENLVIDGQGGRQNIVGDRHGILWQGNYTATHDEYIQPKYGFISNVVVQNFTGGGITCYDTGYAVFTNLRVVNAYITNCTAGINISYFSEYHKFTNVQCRLCTYGCINNGGNNVFVNCDFSGNTNTGMLIDDSSEQSTNNTHGSAIGCMFNHTGNNEGIGVHIIGTHNGFVFDGCQLFYSKIVLSNAYGVEFCNCNFGTDNCDISITGGGLTLFNNNMHGSAPYIAITGNNAVHFNGCYVRKTGAVVSN